jgi:initiation factor 1A
MVRNLGGNKAKKSASKSFNVPQRGLRFAIEEAEVYAIVSRMLGNNICEVLCIDGTTKLCVIRGKFLGKGKRDNRLSRGVWILIGLREWEVTTKDKQKCDLLEVYSDNDKERLIKNTRENFRAFLSITNDDGDVDENQIKFVNDRENDLFDKDAGDDDQENEEDEDEGHDDYYKNTNRLNISDSDEDEEHDDDDEDGVENKDNDKNTYNKPKNIKSETVSITKKLDWIDINDI